MEHIPTVGSLFAGIEGFGLAFERAGARVIWNCEVDAHCRAVLRHHWPGVPRFKDVRTVTGAGLRAAGLVPDILVGGFPCQDVSVAGARAGLDGERSGLFFEFARIAEEAKPPWVLIENVPGLLSSQRGRDMGTVLGVLADIGYVGAWRVLDAQYFGVAQRRRRVFIVGHLGDGDRAAQVLLEPEGLRRDPPARNGQGAGTAAGPRSRLVAHGGEVVAGLTNGLGSGGPDAAHAHAGWLVPAVSNALCSNRGQRNDHNEQTFVPVAYRKATKAHHAEDWERWEEADAINAMASNGMTSSATAVVAPVAFHMTQDPITGPVSPAIGGVKPTTGYSTIAVQQEMAVRRLLPVETLRLQGFPDDHLDGLGLADSVRYRMVGNAVCVPVATWIARRMVAQWA
jgi:DNA (cytosine-5)-methyltransferase 1